MHDTAHEIAVSLEPREIAELVLTLKHTVDATWEHQRGQEAQAHYMSIIAKGCAALGMHNTTPWDERTYMRLVEIAEEGDE